MNSDLVVDQEIAGPVPVEPSDGGRSNAGQPDAVLAGPAEADNGSLGLLVGFLVMLVGFGVFRSWWIPGIVAGLMFMLFMHELGHFVTARMSGMKVTQFFLGFGPKIWSFNRGETEYGLKAIPAGAFVRIIGMTNLDDIDPVEEHRTYRAQPWWQRMVVICAGSAMHFLLALGALVVLFGAYQYAGFHGPAWQVARVVEGSSAAALNIEVGDRIVSFDGQTSDTWGEFGEVVQSAPVGPISVEIEREGAVIELHGELGARPGDVVGRGFGLAIDQHQASDGWVVVAVAANSSADSFGFEVGDVVVRAGGEVKPDQRELSDLLLATEGAPLEVLVLRDLAEQELNGQVVLDRSTPFSGFLGVGPEWVEVESRTWGESVGLAIEDFWTLVKVNVTGLASLLNPLNLIELVGDTAERDGAGPEAGIEPSTLPGPAAGGDRAAAEEPTNRPVSMIGIARLFAESESADQVLYLFMMVNIVVGLFNLAPLLPLDGGHAAVATYEKGRQLVTGDADYRVNAEKLIPLTWTVVVLLVGLGLWAAFLDIFAWPA